MRPVLVVDDDADIRLLLHEVLTGEGFAVTLAADGVEALAMVAAHAPALLVLDVNMPRLDGWGVVRALRARGSGSRR